MMCTANIDGLARDNAPNTVGEISGTGKISCMDQAVAAPGIPLPPR